MKKLDKILLTFAKDLRGIDYDRVNLLISKEKEAELRAMVHQSTEQQIKDLFIEVLDTTDILGPEHPQTNIWYRDLKKKVEEL